MEYDSQYLELILLGASESEAIETLAVINSDQGLYYGNRTRIEDRNAEAA